MNIAATSARWACRRGGPHRVAVTLIELLFVMMILGILAAISLGVLAGATAQARVERTRAIITKIDQLITDKYESYKTRAVPIKVPARMRPVGEPFTDTVADPNLTNGVFDGPPIAQGMPQEAFTDQDNDGAYDWGAAEYRLLALRELMRMEMPNIKADVVEDPLQILNPLTGQFPLRWIIARPALSRNYYRRANSISGGIASWTTPNEGAECLYLIIAAIRDGEDNALDFFAPSEIGDIDNDGMLEIHDAFGNPIEFVRWPAGYSEHEGTNSNNGEWGAPSVDDDGDGLTDNPTEAGWPGTDDILPPPTPQTRNSKKAPDPFDPLKVDGRYRLPNTYITPFALKPLVYSPGPDEEHGVRGSGAVSGLQLCDPFRVEFNSTPARLSAGSCFDPNGASAFADNITNHDFSEK